MTTTPTAVTGTGDQPPVTRTLAMFPGQGSQRVGMAAHLLNEHPRTAGRVLAEADEALGLPLTELCVNGDAAQLSRTDITQPAILATSLAVLEVLREEGGFTPWAVAGHSLGEYTALVAAGVLAAADALRLVRRRGELMAQVSRRVPGAMAAVIGLDADAVEHLCERVAVFDGVVEVANYNEARQTVVSGMSGPVGEVVRLAREAGAEKVVVLDVGAPFHCSLMHEIEAEFAAELDRYPFAEPGISVLSSVTGDAIGDAGAIRDVLRRQLAGPVRWVDVLATARRLGVTDYVEVGPGRVLSGFANKTLMADGTPSSDAPTAAVRSTNDARRIEALLRDRPRTLAAAR